MRLNQRRLPGTGGIFLMIKIGNITPVFLPIAILSGLVLGTFLPGISDSICMWIDPLVLILLFLLFFEIRFDPIPGDL